MILNYISQLVNAPNFTVISVLTILLSVLYLYFKNRNIPPGPMGVPILGCWPFLEHETVHIQLNEMREKYGDVMSLNVAGKLLIHIGSINALKEAHVTKSDCFTRRYTGFNSATEILQKEGIIVVNGEKWSTLRKFFVQAYREYGMSSMKEYMTGPIYDSINATISDLKQAVGKTFNIVPILQNHSLDIFRYTMFRNDDRVSKEELKSVLTLFESSLELGTGKNVLLAGNIAKYLLFPRIKGIKEILADAQGWNQMLSTIIQRHEKSYNPEIVRDMVDNFIKEREERRQRGDPTAKYFTELGLTHSLIQMLGDGVLTLGMFIGYFIHSLLQYPEMQDKIYKEMEDLAGPDRQITLDDKSKLPYTNAFILEVVRTSNFITMFIGHECTKETTLQGYRIPKGAITILSFWTIHRDPKTYDDPDTFNPSRFLTKPGKPKPEPTPLLFGVGKRSCIGEYFVMTQVFLFLTAIVKNFRLEGSIVEPKKAYFDRSMNVTVFSRK